MKRSICVLLLSGTGAVISKNHRSKHAVVGGVVWSRNRLHNRKTQGQKSGKIIQ